MKHVHTLFDDQEIHSFSPPVDSSTNATHVSIVVEEQRTLPVPNATIKEHGKASQDVKIEQVSCAKILTDTTVDDPNKGYGVNDTKRLTVTDPPFYISLHNQFL